MLNEIILCTAPKISVLRIAASGVAGVGEITYTDPWGFTSVHKRMVCPVVNGTRQAGFLSARSVLKPMYSCDNAGFDLNRTVIECYYQSRFDFHVGYDKGQGVMDGEFFSVKAGTYPFRRLPSEMQNFFELAATQLGILEGH